eukprot:scaffold626_cov337-Pavlova_lutheri.AAC.37
MPSWLQRPLPYGGTLSTSPLYIYISLLPSTRSRRRFDPSSFHDPIPLRLNRPAYLWVVVNRPSTDAYVPRRRGTPPESDRPKTTGTMDRRVIGAFVLLTLGTLLTHRLVVRTRAPGARRLLACVPAMLACTFLPLWSWDGWETLTSKLLILTILGWWSNFKLLAFSSGRGPLDPSKGAAAFVASVWLPVNLEESEGTRSESVSEKRNSEAKIPMAANELWMNGCAKVVSLYCLLYLAEHEYLPRHVLLLAYILMLYSFLGAVLDIVALVAVYAGDFWGRRWNMMTANLLKAVVYSPIVEGNLVRISPFNGRASPTRVALAICATFVVSGIMHEIVYVFAAGRTHFEWFMFFAAQGPLLLLEKAVQDKFKSGRTGGNEWFLTPALRDGLVEQVQQDIVSSLYLGLPGS